MTEIFRGWTLGWIYYWIIFIGKWINNSINNLLPITQCATSEQQLIQ